MGKGPTVDELLARAGDQIDQLGSESGWRAFLEGMRRLRKYSIRNQLLLALQCPAASSVAGYREWQKQGRQVQKGAQALWIVAPRMRRLEGEDEDRHVVAGFTSTWVFDISQTDGPEVVVPPLLGSSAPEGMWADLSARVAEVHTLTVADDLPDGVLGMCHRDTKEIRVAARLDPGDRVRCLLHELGHAYDEVNDDEETREIVADSVAYVLGGMLGVSLEVSSIGYLARYGADRDRLLRLASRVQMAVREIEARFLEPAMVEVAA